jgi:hypothetical protein
VDEPPDARFSRKPGDPCCGFDVNGMEGLWPALPVEAHGIHDALDTRDGSGNGAIVIDVGLDRVELNAGEKRCNAFWMPRRYPHREITLNQTLDDALAEKASPAEDGHLPSCHCSVPRDAVLKFRRWTDRF